MRISDWSSDVCSSDLKRYHAALREAKLTFGLVRHAAMRIGGQPTGDVLRLAEGFEEAVSVTQLSGGKFTVWGAGGIRRYGLIAIPERIRKIVIYSHHGPEAEEIGKAHVLTPVPNAPTDRR